MKNLLLLLTLMTSTAFAQIEFNEERVTFDELISVHGLRCVTLPATSDEYRTFTELQNIYVSHPAIELKHLNSSIKGCDLESLDTLVEEAHMRFGHVDAKITVIKKTAKHPRIVFGKCQRNYHEQLELDLGHGVVLKTSEIGILKPAEGC